MWGKHPTAVTTTALKTHADSWRLLSVRRDVCAQNYVWYVVQKDKKPRPVSLLIVFFPLRRILARTCSQKSTKSPKPVWNYGSDKKSWCLPCVQSRTSLLPSTLSNFMKDLLKELRPLQLWCAHVKPRVTGEHWQTQSELAFPCFCLGGVGPHKWPLCRRPTRGHSFKSPDSPAGTPPGRRKNGAGGEPLTYLLWVIGCKPLPLFSKAAEKSTHPDRLTVTPARTCQRVNGKRRGKASLMLHLQLPLTSMNSFLCISLHVFLFFSLLHNNLSHLRMTSEKEGPVAPLQELCCACLKIVHAIHSPLTWWICWPACDATLVYVCRQTQSGQIIPLHANPTAPRHGPDWSRQFPFKADVSLFVAFSLLA